MFKKLLLVTLLALSHNHFCVAMEDGFISDGDSTPPLPEDILKITMPDETTLRSFFSEAGLDYFVENTKIIKIWAGKTRPIREIDLDKELMIETFQETHSGGLRCRPYILDNLINSVIDKILKDSPELKAELQRLRDAMQKY